MPFGPIRRIGWRGLRGLHRRCVRRPVFRTLAGSVVVCDARLARDSLADAGGVLDHPPAFWRPGGVALPPDGCAALNRWVHRALAAEDVHRSAGLAVDSLAAARGDLHRACLHATAEAHRQALGLDDADLRAVVADFLDTVFHSMVTGSRRRVDDAGFQRLCARAGAVTAGGAVAGLPELDAAVRGEVYLRAVTAFVGASAAALTWLVCAFQRSEPVEARRVGDVREADPRHVALEVLRLWPPAWQHRRPVRHDHRLGPLSALRGDDVVVPTYAMHRHPRYWTDPAAFDPARWADLPDRPDAFLPFAVGPGACVAAVSEVRRLGAVAEHLAACPPLPLTRRAAEPHVTALLSAPAHVLGAVR
ncbi:cytochrome P450 [Actinosynnema sp. NPDC023587]|uniref:cytochrome P450 n=1 Tax=Actinosynnema sp. NPDC023587 TaxID=3154695 RepID=UPI0034111B4F